MVHIVLASHGPLAKAMLDSAAMLYGRSENIEAIGLYEEDSLELFHSKLSDAIHGKEEVLLLVDIPGGSPSNQALMLTQENPHVQVVAGMNLMMLLECMIQMEHVSLKELVDIALSTGIKCIQKIQFESSAKDDLDALLE